MNLHRTTGKPDWEISNQMHPNGWQRLAIATHGLITPGNILTIAGFAVVAAGLTAIWQYHFWFGALALVVGRLCDIADGWLADHTGTKSPLGELLDASLDKLGTVMTIIVFILSAVAPWWILVAMLLPHIIISGITLIARIHGVGLHPSRIGKLSMAAAWAGLVGFIIMSALSVPGASVGGTLVYSIVAASVVMGLYAAVEYAQELQTHH